MNESKKSNSKTLGVVGILIAIGTLYGDQVSYLNDWSTAEMVGFNIWTLLAVIGGFYLGYRAFFKK